MTDTPKDALAVPVRNPVPSRAFSLMPQSLGEAREIATLIANSDFAPKDYKGKPDNVIVALQMGADLGLKPMQALQNIAVINGRPSIYGDAALALVQASGQIERFHETFEGIFPEDSFTAICIVKRRGFPDEIRQTFSIGDAKAAKLWNKRGHNGGDTPWVTYPKRMLQMRARGFALRDAGSDMLLGLVLVEEAQDYPAIEGTVVASEVVTSEPPKAIGIFLALPEAIQENIEKGFTTLNIAPGARLAKINEYFGGDGINPDEQAAALLDWLKDEYAKRKTGQPRKKASNAKATDAAPAVPVTPKPATPASEPRGAGDPPVAESESAKPAEVVGAVEKGDLF